MKKKAILLFFMFMTIGLLAITINIPADYPTIQGGINASDDGDEIIVAPGTYMENINFNGKAVILGSLFYTTLDTSYISQTIIDGNQNGSVVTFHCYEGSASVLSGFKITNGHAEYGGGIYCYQSSPGLDHLMITDNSVEYNGGGIYCNYYSNPFLDNAIIRDNSAGEVGGGICCNYYCLPVLNNLIVTNNSAGDSGGGICCQHHSSLSLKKTAITDNSASDGGGIYCLYSSPEFVHLTITGNLANTNGGGFCCNSSSPSLENVTIKDNSADEGGGVYCSGNYVPIFSSENRCNIYLNNINNRGNGNDIYSVHEIDVIVDTFTVLNPTNFHAAPIENFTFDILHGFQEQINADLYVSPIGDNNNTGLTIEDPLKTIQHACSIILADNLNPHTIHLAEGIYSPSTNGEFFPVDIPDFVSICGLSETGVILNAEGMAGVIRLRNVEYAAISNLKITNGYSPYGGGIACSSSYLELENVTITNNSAEYFGGGIYCSSSIIIFSSENRCNIYLNNTNIRGNGTDLYSYTDIDVIVDTFTVINPTDFHAAPIDNYTFDILHGLQEQINADLYVSPEGDNSNSGLTIDGPLRTIQHACSIILADSKNLHTIHLAEGTYSPSTNGEFFPIDIPEFITVNGVSETEVILNAERVDGVIRIRNVEYASISNLTIINGNATSGGGINCRDSSPSIENVTIMDNSAGSGAGIYCLYSNLSLENVTIIHNLADNSGGGIYCLDSNPSLENITIIDNSAEYGGGIRCTWSNPSLNNVLITDNSADNGAGIFCDNSNPNLENVTISNGHASNGGGISCYESSPNLKNVRITDNSASYGGGIDCTYSSPILVNVTIANNSAGWYGGGMHCTDSSNPNLVNCIIWNNSPCGIDFWYYVEPNTITIAYSNIEGGEEGIVPYNEDSIYWLDGNIDADPLFVDALLRDYNLMEDSPCIDAGTSYFEYDDEVLVDLSEDEYYGIAPDMGAYEFLDIDELSIWSGDTNNSGFVDESDIEAIAFYWKEEGESRDIISFEWVENECPANWTDPFASFADCNGDGCINITDVLALCLNWAKSHEINYNSITLSDDDLYSKRDNFIEIYNSLGSSEIEIKIRNYIAVKFNLPLINPISVNLLYNNYPNPFNPSTNIRYSLAENGQVELAIYNIKGQLIKELVQKDQNSGDHSIIWNGYNMKGFKVSSGIYFYKLKLNNTIIDTKKMILIK